MARLLLLIHQPAAGGYLEYVRIASAYLCYPTTCRLVQSTEHHILWKTSAMFPSLDFSPIFLTSLQLGRDRDITACIDEIGSIAMNVLDDASRLMSTQCLFAAGLYCTDNIKRECIAELITEHATHTGWPSNVDLAGELRLEWSRQERPG
ncbi:hypothetical protein LTR27_009776 [Elasticomyces elasticus]|nr:hypothetical protein LTR27_009776 [Elasticomyces elasticus]